MKFTITNQSAGTFLEKIVLRISYVGAGDLKYQIIAKPIALKSALTESIAFKFSPRYPPALKFYFILEVFYQEKRLAEIVTENCELDSENLDAKVRIQSIQCLSSVVLPNNPIIFWVTLAIQSIPPIDIYIHAKLSQKEGKLVEQSFPVLGDFWKSGLLKLPFTLAVGDFDGKSLPLLLEISLLPGENQGPIQTKSIALKGTSLIRGLHYQYVGFKHEMRMGETGYLMAEVENLTNNTVSGKAIFTFYSPDLAEIPAFNRKFKIDRQNHDAVVEDFTVPDSLGGYQYWVACRSQMNVKPAGISMVLEGLSPMAQAVPRHPMFIAQLQSPVTTTAFFGDDLAIGVDLRVESDQKLNNLECEVIQCLGNISKTVLKRFPVKKFAGQLTSFHWRVPSVYSQCVLDVQFLINNRPIHPANVQKKILDLNLFPRMKN